MENFNELLSKIFQTTVYGGPGCGFTKHGDSDWHLMTLFSLVLQTKAKNILELGVRHGDTSLPLTMGAHIVGGKVDAVDIEPTEWICPEILKPNYEFHQSDAIEYLKKVNKKYDIVYVDDWHSYEHVSKEIELIDNFTDKSSLILLHDLMGNYQAPNYYWPTGTTESDPEWANGGPYRAVKELDLSKWEWATIPVNNGLTILRKK
jgi:cephalosporin hydroxylase